MKFLLLSCIALALYGANADYVDDAEALLETLKTSTALRIVSAHNRLQSYSSSFLTNSDNVFTQAKIDVDSQNLKVLDEIEQLKNLAISVGVDPTTCSSSREELLATLPAEYNGKIELCIADVNDQQNTLIIDDTYKVDVYYMRVTVLEYQFHLCNRDIDCIEPILTQIRTTLMYMQDYIDIRLIGTNNNLNAMKLLVQGCADNGLAEYVSESNSLRGIVETCLEEQMN